jgi:hypothetical protein
VKDYDFVTVYVPYAGRTGRTEFSHLISEEVIAWLDENIGKGTISYRHWLLEHDNDTYAWTYKGTSYDPSTNYTKIVREFCFRNMDDATRFKLVWGG